MQTDRKKLRNNDFLNTVILVILDAKATFGDEARDITSFNIYKNQK